MNKVYLMEKSTKALVVLCCGAFLFSTVFSLLICWQLENKKMAKKIETDITKVILDSFIETCNGNGYVDLNEWQRINRKLWNLDYIAWSAAEDFMVVSEDAASMLYYGVWKGSYSSGDVFCSMKLDKE